MRDSKTAKATFQKGQLDKKVLKVAVERHRSSTMAATGSEMPFVRPLRHTVRPSRGNLNGAACSISIRIAARITPVSPCFPVLIRGSRSSATIRLNANRIFGGFFSSCTILSRLLPGLLQMHRLITHLAFLDQTHRTRRTTLMWRHTQ